MIDLTEQQDRCLQRGNCPFCNSTRFLHGPCGGDSKNIRCVGCGKEFCFSPPFKSLLLDRDAPDLYRGEFLLKSEVAEILDGLDAMFGKPAPTQVSLGWRAFLILLLSSSLVTGAIIYLIRHASL